MTADQIAPNVLVHVAGVSYSAEYSRLGRPGSLQVLLLHPFAARRLHHARRLLKARSSRDEALDLHVWDGYRPQAVQFGIFEDYVEELMSTGLRQEEAQEAAVTFVRHPKSVYPHGTGGTVDLTLIVNGHLADMGTGFDDFTAKAHRRWFLENPPTSDRDAAAMRHRELLDEAMRGAGFAGIDDEWWHYEWGTEHWALLTGRRPVLTRLCDVPTTGLPAAG